MVLAHPVDGADSLTSKARRQLLFFPERRLQSFADLSNEGAAENFVDVDRIPHSRTSLLRPKTPDNLGFPHGLQVEAETVAFGYLRGR
ncbi:hypothetical protein [Bradyrhizobium sp. BR 1432]|uniref:hypothetical protein n=1 Tax=Bradyrhizobium sp. BR 1432 TaxID=3447966 RepID=UPI003EE6828E